jgi:ABC-2 type transport system permease protein
VTETTSSVPWRGQGYGEVFDRGYVSYDGPREGRRRAVRSLFAYSIKRSMGVRKPWTAKVLLILLYVSSFVPMIVIIGITALVPGTDVASYPDYFGGIFFLVGIFAGIVIPEILIPDRSEKTLTLYFARAITRFDYVIPKLAAAAVLIMTISVIPAIILWLGRQLTADSPATAMRHNIDDLGRVVLFGTLLALTLGTISLAISSMTDRKGIAIAVIVIAFLVISLLSELAVIELDTAWSDFLVLGSLQMVFSAISSSLFNTAPNADVRSADLDAWVYYAWVCFIINAGSLFARWRYAPRNAS